MKKSQVYQYKMIVYEDGGELFGKRFYASGQCLFYHGDGLREVCSERVCDTLEAATEHCVEALTDAANDALNSEPETS